MRLLSASKEILRGLDICPWVPIDVLVPLVGARRRVSVYQALARLRSAGLVQVQRTHFGRLVGEKALGLWATTDDGRVALRASAAVSLPEELARRAWLPLLPLERRRRPGIDDPVRLAAARALAWMIATEAARGRRLRLSTWEAPWIRKCPRANGRLVRLPAAAILEARADGDPAAIEAVLVLPDLGTAPVVRFRAMLRRLVEALVEADTSNVRRLPRLIVVTTNVYGDGARGAAWTKLVQRLCREGGLQRLPMTLLEWQQVNTQLGGVRVASGPPQAAGATRQRRRQLRVRRVDELLDLLGRHPFLTIEQIATLLAVSPHRVRQLRRSLVADGLVRDIPPCELDSAGGQAMADGGHRLELAELTASGRRRLARVLGLPSAAARRHHGLFGGSARQRRRALRALAHTIGANGVFVALAVAARAARARGQDEALEEWRPAAACERRRCKPDGYGRYRRGDAHYGFLLEYDRGTERASQYAAKLAAYYAYRDSGQATRDYAGFPDVLFVTISGAAEARILAGAAHAWARFGGAPLSISVATTDRIAATSHNILGPVWRRPQFIAARLRVGEGSRRPTFSRGNVASVAGPPR